MRSRWFWYKNMMLGGCLFANLCAIAVVSYLLTRPYSDLSTKAWEMMQQFGWCFDPLAVSVMIWCALFYERPIRNFLNLQKRNECIPEKVKLLARQRILNEPYFLIALSVILWMLAGIFYST